MTNEEKVNEVIDALDGITTELKTEARKVAYRYEYDFSSVGITFSDSIELEETYQKFVALHAEEVFAELYAEESARASNDWYDQQLKQRVESDAEYGARQITETADPQRVQ